MKVIKKSKMPDETLIQLEDWRKDYGHVKTLIIAIYLMSKNYSKSGFIEKNERFRLELTRFTNDEQVKSIFKQLEEGQICLEDLKKHFSNGKKDEFYLGLSDSE